jgi:hypothetical protein
VQPHLEFIGLLLIGLALLHGIFPRYFKWKEELSGVSLVTRQILHVHTFFIALTVLLMGLLCLLGANDLVHTGLGRRIALGLFVFWFIRLLIQFIGYSSELWKGKRLETFAHIAFSVLWSYLSVVFLLTGLGWDVAG